jgi:hypothetical protein
MLRYDVPDLAFGLSNAVHGKLLCAESVASILLLQHGPEDKFV